MKKCEMCGCHMDDSHEGDICECCQDDMASDSESRKFRTIGRVISNGFADAIRAGGTNK